MIIISKRFVYDRRKKIIIIAKWRVIMLKINNNEYKVLSSEIKFAIVTNNNVR